MLLCRPNGEWALGRKYDFLQVSCDIAHRIFKERALVCDKGQAKWNTGVDQRPPALAVQVNEVPE